MDLELKAMYSLLSDTVIYSPDVNIYSNINSSDEIRANSTNIIISGGTILLYMGSYKGYNLFNISGIEIGISNSISLPLQRMGD